MRKYFLPCGGPVLCFRAKFGDGLVQGNSKLIDSIIQVCCIYRRLKIEIYIKSQFHKAKGMNGT